jgi:hypothetical protein
MVAKILILDLTPVSPSLQGNGALARQENFWFLQCSPDGAAVPWPGQDGQLPPNNSGHPSALARQENFWFLPACGRQAVQSVIKSKNQKEMQE